MWFEVVGRQHCLSRVQIQWSTSESHIPTFIFHPMHPQTFRIIQVDAVMSFRKMHETSFMLHTTATAECWLHKKCADCFYRITLSMSMFPFSSLSSAGFLSFGGAGRYFTVYFLIVKHFLFFKHTSQMVPPSTPVPVPVTDLLNSQHHSFSHQSLLAPEAKWFSVLLVPGCKNNWSTSPHASRPHNSQKSFRTSTNTIFKY